MPQSPTKINPVKNRSQKLEHALATANHGFAVFPVVWSEHDGEDWKCSCGSSTCHKTKNHGKHPLRNSNGFKDAATDPGEIIMLWAANPEANIGLWPGHTHLMVDLDMKPAKGDTGPINGLTNYAEFMSVSEDDILKSSYCVRTPSGGYHLYYTIEEGESFGNSANTVIPAVDIRGHGGYVLAPGSMIRGESYNVVCNLEPIALPDKLREILKQAMQRDRNVDAPIGDLDTLDALDQARSVLAKRSGAIEGEGGNEHTYATACIVKDCGVSAEICLELMMEASGWNEVKCRPPWSANGLAKVVRNAYQYGKLRPGCKGSELLKLKFEGIDLECQDVDPEDFLQEANDNEIDSCAEDPRLEHEICRSRRFLPMSEAQQDALPPIRYHVDRIIQRTLLA